MTLNHPVLKRMVRKLERRASLEDSDREALSSLTFKKRTFDPGGYIVREGTVATECALILDGFRPLQFTTEQLVEEPNWVMSQVGMALGLPVRAIPYSRTLR